MPWPPTLEGAGLPWWARARDILLTLLAWLMMAWMLRELVFFVGAALLYAWNPAAPLPADLDLALSELRPYLAVLVLLMLALAGLAWRRRAILQSVPRADGGPAPLEPPVHAAHFGLAPEQLARLQAGKVQTVQFDAGGQVTGVAEAGPGRTGEGTPPAP